MLQRGVVTGMLEAGAVVAHCGILEVLRSGRTLRGDDGSILRVDITGIFVSRAPVVSRLFVSVPVFAPETGVGPTKKLKIIISS